MLTQGEWLYRNRSYLPLPLVALLFVSVALGSSGEPSAATAWDLLAVAAGVLGFGIRAHALGHAPPFTSGGTVHLQVADSLNRTGMYSLVRHPLYLGNLLLWLGISFVARSPWASVAAVALFLVIYERIMLVEERFLEGQFPRSYRAWARRTPAILPRVTSWRAPREAFAWRRILRREYNGLAAFGAIWVGLTTLRQWAGTGDVQLTPWNGGVVLGVATIAAACIVIKKRTRWLETPVATAVSRRARGRPVGEPRPDSVDRCVPPD